MNRSLVLLFLLVLQLTFTSVGVAQSPTRVFVLGFDGWRAEQVRDAIVAELNHNPQLTLVSLDDAIETGQQIGQDITSPEGMGAIVRHLEVSLLITGTIEGRGRNARTVILILNSDGDEILRQEAPSPRRSSDRERIGLTAFRAILLAETQNSQTNAIQPRETPSSEPETPLSEDANREEEEIPPASEEAAQRNHADSDATEETSTWTPPTATILAGVRIRDANTRVDRPPAMASMGAYAFNSSPFPEIALEASIRPWTQKRTDARGGWFNVEGGVSAGNTYLGASGTFRTMTSMRFGIDGGYAFMFDNRVEIIPALGLGLEGIDLEQGDGFPSTLYLFLRPGVRTRIRLYETLVIAELGVSGRIGLDSGGIAPGFGPEALFGGLETFGALTGRIAEGFSWAARVGLMYQALSFSGGGGNYGIGFTGEDVAWEVRLLAGWSL